ncbi:hypothetical protein MVG78_20800 (plasmid) [Roseomonas gilardii subsp. gilardii]|uniref:hypothetical protein n=1 Tax=Roseomonas gilardii TaxID=257708 RepID=UPI001FFAAC92|nr:hypothetical protein [Roseomonas gilardii]UPG74537.1 hypothetical protein MVG78_20800 [Roseomonas gilardii subsp. gilardii]
MSSMISNRLESLRGESLQDLAGRRRNLLRRLGAGAVVMATLCMLFAWSFVGSLFMGLRTPATSQPRMVVLWLCVAAGIILGGFVGELLVLARSKE